MTSLKNLNWKRSGRVLLWGATGFLAFNLGRVVFPGLGRVNAQSASPVAYTVMRTEDWYDTTGKLIKQGNAHYVEAVKSDGSSMWRGSAEKTEQRKLAFANGD